jgi:hypothetical protein
MSENYFYPNRKTREDLESKKHDAVEALALLKKIQRTAGGRTIAFPKRIALLSTTLSELFKQLGEGLVVLGNDEYYRQSKKAYEDWQATLKNDGNKTSADKTQEKRVKTVEKIQAIVDDGSLAHAEKTVGRFKEPKQKYRHDEGYKKTEGGRSRKEGRKERKINVRDYS